MEQDSNVRAPLLDVDDHRSSAAEELLRREPVPWDVLSQLAAWEAGNLWRISWASVLITLSSFTLSLVTQMFVGHLGELELAGASITNIGIQGLAYGIMVNRAFLALRCPCSTGTALYVMLLARNAADWHGERGADGVRPGLRGQEVQGHGRRVPEGARAPVRNRRRHRLPLLVRRPVPAAHRAGHGRGRGGAAVCTRPGAAAARIRALLPDAEVPAGPKHRQPGGVHHAGRASLPHPHLVARRVRARVRPPRRGADAELLLVGARGVDMGVHRLEPSLQGDVDRTVCARVQRPLGILQTRLRVGRHASVSDLIRHCQLLGGSCWLIYILRSERSSFGLTLRPATGRGFDPDFSR